MPAKQTVDYLAAIKSLVVLIVGILVSAVVLGAGVLAFQRIVGIDLVSVIGTGTSVGLVLGGAIVAIGLIMAATILAAKQK